MTSSKRIHFLDNLRALVIVLVVVLHGSMTYMAYAPPWWYVLDTQNSLFFTILVLLIDIPIMLVLFFIAGYFALPSLVKRGPGKFVQDKFIRVGAPWLFGALLLAPPISYLIYYTRNIPMGFFQFWASDFWTKVYQQSVYWYLGVLFFFFLILAWVYRTAPRLQAAPRQVDKPTWKLFVGFWALMSLGMVVINQFFPVDTWYTRAYILVFQPLRVPLYIGYFGLGIYAHLRGWFTTEGYSPRLLPWGVVWLVSGLLYLGNRLFVMPASPEPVLLVQVAHAALFNAFCLSSLMAGVALFRQRFDHRTPFWGSLSANSYGIYYIHPLTLFPTAYLFVSVSLPLWLKATVVILLGILLSWAVSALVLTRLPGLRRVFG